MAQPEILVDGATPRREDTRWRILVKTVGVLFNAANSPNPSDAPVASDTRWKLLEKWNRLANGS